MESHRQTLLVVLLHISEDHDRAFLQTIDQLGVTPTAEPGLDRSANRPRAIGDESVRPTAVPPDGSVRDREHPLASLEHDIHRGRHLGAQNEALTVSDLDDGDVVDDVVLDLGLRPDRRDHALEIGGCVGIDGEATVSPTWVDTVATTPEIGARIFV